MSRGEIVYEKMRSIYQNRFDGGVYVCVKCCRMRSLAHGWHKWSFQAIFAFEWCVNVYVFGVRADFLVRCQCQRIFAFPCCRNRSTSSSCFFLDSLFHDRKKANTFEFYHSAVISHTFPYTFCFRLACCLSDDLVCCFGLSVSLFLSISSLLTFIRSFSFSCCVFFQFIDKRRRQKEMKTE